MGDRSWCRFEAPTLYAKLVGYAIANGYDNDDWTDEQWRDLVFEPAYNDEGFHTEEHAEYEHYVVMSESEQSGGGYTEAQALAKWGVPFQHTADAYSGGWESYRSCCDGHTDYACCDHGEAGYQIPFGDDCEPLVESINAVRLFHNHWLRVQKCLDGESFTPIPGSIAAKWEAYVAQRLRAVENADTPALDAERYASADDVAYDIFYQ